MKKLGEGGKGVVYKTRDTVLNRVVAIKMLKSAVSTDEAYTRFIREAQAVAKLNHPNIVSIHDIGKENEKQFFVLEFVDGMSMRGLMETYPEGKCDVQTVLRAAIDICGALQFAHSNGVLHRDVKPENILITQEGVAKLMDFGLARMLGYRSLNAQKCDVIKFAELLYEYGLVYLERNSEGDREKAYSLLDKALAIYQKMEAQKRIEGIIAKKKLLTA